MIYGKRVRFRSIELSDLEYMIQLRNDPRVYQSFYSNEPISMVMQERWFREFLEKDDEILFIIELLETKKPIGMTGLVHWDRRNRRAEYGRFVLDPNLLDQGLGKECELLFLQYVFDYLNLNKFYGEVLSRNAAVIKLHEYTGFKVTGRMQQHIWKDGQWQDVTYIEMLRSDYEAVTKPKIEDLFNKGE